MVKLISEGVWAGTVQAARSHRFFGNTLTEGRTPDAVALCQALFGVSPFKGDRDLPPRFRTIQVYPKDLRALPGHPDPAVSWPQRVPRGSPCST